MKKCYLTFVLIVSFLLTACTEYEGILLVPPTDFSIINTKVIDVNDDTILVADCDDENGLYQVTLTEDLGDLSDILKGDLIELGFDGLIMESYPAMIANPSYIKLQEKGDDFVGLYLNIFMDLYNADSGLNSEVNLLAVDLSKDEILSQGEKNALIFMLQNETQLSTRLATFDELVSEDLISVEDDTKFAFFDNGILFSIKTTSINNSKFEFSAQKWRSSMGAYFFDDATAKKKNGVWGYTVESYAIS